MKAVILIGLFLVSCKVENRLPTKTREQVSDEMMYYIGYWKDKRTGLCFAGSIHPPNSLLTNVPCTPEVEATIFAENKNYE